MCNASRIDTQIFNVADDSGAFDPIIQSIQSLLWKFTSAVFNPVYRTYLFDGGSNLIESHRMLSLVLMTGFLES